MALHKYKQKRNFKDTPEPSENGNQKKGALKFVVQRHDASRLHYDFRLEMEGVLKSWAVPKGPSLDPQDKRLAMMVEDHPFAYRNFEGIIPEGNYGAGIVEIWDEGTYHSLDSKDRKESEESLLQQLEKGSLKFVLQGEKLKGEFALVKMNRPDAENAWLLIKHNDEHAVAGYDSEDHVPANSKIVKKKKTKPASVKKNRDEARTHVEADTLKAYGKDPMPHEVRPMLAKLKDKAFDGEDWIFEVKWDGYRAIAEVQKGKVNLYSRNLLSFNDKYPGVVKALEGFGHDVVLDGEVVVLDENGVSDFQALQNHEDRPTSDIYYQVFDLLYLDGFDIRSLPLVERKKYLKEVFPDLDNVQYSDHLEKEGKAFFKLAVQQKLEGIIAKKADTPYRTGARSEEWLKIKSIKKQEAVICGFTAPRGSRTGFGALVLGVYENNELQYIGHAGGGFNQKSIAEVKKLMDNLIRDTSPFKKKVKTNEKVTWVKPELICEVAFAGWTQDMQMRQPIYQGMRTDKSAKEVKREQEDESAKSAHKVRSKPMSKSAKNKEKEVERKPLRQEVKVSNLQKVYWPEEGYTKGDLINYYQEIASYILPYLKDRPQSLHRHPNGIHEDSFFQKDMGDGLPEWMTTVEVFSESNKKNIHYLVCQDADTLMYINNLGCIEVNTWHSRTQNLENPDYCLIDLDPSDHNSFDEVVETALVVKKHLDLAGAEAYVKTSGSSGIHILVPLGAAYDFDQSKDFAHLICQMVHQDLPKLTSLERSPKARPKQIYLDYLQNRTGQTVAVPYSVRPKPGATVSTPLEWNEVKKGLHPSQFTLKNIQKRLQSKGDLIKGIIGNGIDMQACLERLAP